MKKISLLLALLLVFSLFVGCSNTQSPPAKQQEETPASPDTSPKNQVKVTIAGLKGPTSIGMIKLIDEKALNSEQYSVEYIQESAPDALTGKIINGDIQISSVPINLAPLLYNKTNGSVQILAVNTVGNLYILGTDEIQSIKDLEGKTLGMSAKGSTPDYAINYILDQNELSDKVELDYVLDHGTLAQSVIAGDTTIALLPQPFVTQVIAKNPNVKILIDLNEEWNAATNGQSELSTGCIIVNKKFAEENKEFVQKFLKQYQTSVDWVNQNPGEASLLTEKNGVMPNAQVVEKAIPYCGIVLKNASDAKEGLNSFYKILFDFNPASIGGSLPDEDFYYSE